MYVTCKHNKKEYIRCFVLLDTNPETDIEVDVEKILDLWTPGKYEKFELIEEYKDGFRQYVITVSDRHLWKMLRALTREEVLDLVDMYNVIPIKKR